MLTEYQFYSHWAVYCMLLPEHNRYAHQEDYTYLGWLGALRDLGTAWSCPFTWPSILKLASNPKLAKQQLHVLAQVLQLTVYTVFYVYLFTNTKMTR